MRPAIIMHNKNIYSLRVHAVLDPSKKSIYAILLISLIAFMLAASKIYGMSPDDENYNTFFELARIEKWNIVYATRFEPGFSVLSAIITRLFEANQVVYGLIAALAIFTKEAVLRVVSKNYWIFWFVTLFYFARYFPFHELTQLRAACAISLLFAAYLQNKNKNKLTAIGLILVATTFHLSSVAVIPFLFINPKKLWVTLLIASVTGAILHMTSQAITFGLANFINVFANYQTQGFGEDTPNPFSIAILLDWMILLHIIITWKKQNQTVRHLTYLLIVGMTIFYSLLEFAVIAHRLRELFSLFFILLIPELLKTRHSRIAAFAFGSISIVLYSYFFIFSKAFFQ